MQRWVIAVTGIVLSVAVMGAVSAPVCAQGVAGVVVTGVAPDEQGSFATRQVAVDFSGVDTASPEGGVELYGRIVKAAVAACRAPSVRRVNEGLRAKIENCQKQARANAVEWANIPQLGAAAQHAGSANSSGLQ